MTRQRYQNALSFAEFLESATSQQEMWASTYRRAVVPAALAERAERLVGPWHLLVLAEDWCGDAFNTVPFLARLAETTDGLDLRILSRDENPDLMDAHLTGTARSIPVVMALDAVYVERGWWGPRPRELQTWFVSEGRTLPNGERYKELRRFYVQDRGRTTLDEVVELLESCESPEDDPSRS